MPKISIIVPVYNTEKYIKNCLNSIVNQTFQDIEIIIINDGSTDNSESIILEFKKRYPKIIRYFKKENQGVAETRNFGIKKVLGEYFMFVDSDDYIDNNLCQEIQKYIEKDIDIIKYKMKIILDNKQEKIDGPVFNVIDGQDAFNELCFRDKFLDTPCLYLFNKNFYKHNNFKFIKNTYHEDFGLIPLVIIKAKKVISTNLYSYNYIQTSNSITRNVVYCKTVKRAQDMLKHYDNMIKSINNYCLSIETKSNVKQYYTNAVLSKIKTLEKEDKNKYIIEIKKRKMLNNIKPKNIKQLLKKVITYITLNYK